MIDVADMEIDIEDGLAVPDEVAALPITDDDEDYDGDFTPKGQAIPESIYEVEV